MVMKVPNPEAIAKRIGIPVRDWVFNCYFIACKVVKAGITPGGTPVYGHFLGEIREGSPWEHRKDVPFIRHGWIVMPDGSIVDPTRWCFEGDEPFIFTATKEAAEADYDEGGNRWLAGRVRPRPVWDPNDEKPFLILFGDAENFVRSVLQCPKSQPTNKYNFSQLIWLANLPYDVIGEYLCDICDALKPAKMVGLIPIDNRERAEREHGGTHGPTSRPATAAPSG